MPSFPALSARASGLRASVFSSLVKQFGQVKGETYPLHVGDTWLAPPDGCRMEQLALADHPGMNRYTSVPGLPALRETIAARVARRTGLPVVDDQVAVTAGATGGLAAGVGALVSAGDEVLILAPAWPVFGGMVRTFGGTPVHVPFIGMVDSPESARAAVEAAITPRTVAVYINTPNNPTGKRIPRSWLEAVVEVARARDLWLFSDEVYEDMVFAGEHTWVRSLAPERTLSVWSFSKGYGMAGNRCGYMVGPEAWVAAARKISTYTYYCAPRASQEAGIIALGEAGDRWLATTVPAYKALGDAAADRLGVERPEGSTFLFLDVADRLDARGLDGFLEDGMSRGLLIAPGPIFGPYPTHVRVCFTSVEPERVRTGIEVLAGLLGR